MKLVISFDELHNQEYPVIDKPIDISDYWELTRHFLEYEFAEWDFDLAFSKKTFLVDSENKEVSIELNGV